MHHPSIGKGKIGLKSIVHLIMMVTIQNKIE